VPWRVLIAVGGEMEGGRLGGAAASASAAAAADARGGMSGFAAPQHAMYAHLPLHFLMVSLLPFSCSFLHALCCVFTCLSFFFFVIFLSEYDPLIAD
jgi:hypothetical protein